MNKRGMNLPVENYPPLENENFMTSPSLDRPPLKIKNLLPPLNFSNFSDVQILSIPMSLCKFLQILEKTTPHMAA